MAAKARFYGAKVEVQVLSGENQIARALIPLVMARCPEGPDDTQPSTDFDAADAANYVAKLFGCYIQSPPPGWKEGEDFFYVDCIVRKE